MGQWWSMDRRASLVWCIDRWIVRRVLFEQYTTMCIAFSWPRDKQRHWRVISFRAHVAIVRAREFAVFFGELLPQNGIPSLTTSRCDCKSRCELNSKTNITLRIFYILYVGYIFIWLLCRYLRHLSIFINILYYNDLLRISLKLNLYETHQINSDQCWGK